MANSDFFLGFSEEPVSQINWGQIDHRTLWSKFPLLSTWTRCANLLQAARELSPSLEECPVTACGARWNPQCKSFGKEERLADACNVFQIRKAGKITNPGSVDTLYVHHVVSTEVTGRRPSTTKIKESLP